MSTAVNEALLEMIYLRPLVSRFERHFGKRVLMLLKPTPGRERFLGFDQGWVKPAKPIGDSRTAEAAIQVAIEEGHSKVPLLALMLFLQFKHVTHVSRRRPDRNGDYIGQPSHCAPHYRVSLDLRVGSRRSGARRAAKRRLGGGPYSQHETLQRLARVRRAHVYYACPLLDDTWDVYEGPPLNALRLVPVAGSPQFAADTNHYIIFKDRRARAAWCSDPIEAEDRSFEEWLAEAKPELAPLAAIDETLNLLEWDRLPLPDCGLIFVFGPQLETVRLR